VKYFYIACICGLIAASLAADFSATGPGIILGGLAFDFLLLLVATYTMEWLYRKVR